MPKERPVRAAAHVALQRLRSTSQVARDSQQNSTPSVVPSTPGTTASKPTTRKSTSQKKQRLTEGQTSPDAVQTEEPPTAQVAQPPTAQGALRRSGRKRRSTAGTDIDDAAMTTTASPRDGAHAAVEKAAAVAGPKRKRSVKSQPISCNDTNTDVGDSTAPVYSGTISRIREHQLLQEGYSLVVGVDEAGRGPLAGPVVTAACALPADLHLNGIDDSKKLSEKLRNELYEALTSHPGVRWSAHVVPRESIDSLNILQATLLGMRQAVQAVVGVHKLQQQQHGGTGASIPGQQAQEAAGPPAAVEALPGSSVHSVHEGQCYCIVDGNKMPSGMPIPGELAKGGDRYHYCIAAASIIAKVTRDRLMEQYDKQYPQYGFAKHKGYGTAAHMAAIRQHGACPIHRRSFEPIKSMAAAGGLDP